MIPMMQAAWLAWALAGVQAPLPAAQQPPRIVEASVIVTAPAPPPGARAIPAETLEATPGLTTDERLRTVAGFSLFRRSSSRISNPTTHGVTMRGLSASGASRGLVLLDGIPLNDGFGGWVTWTRLAPAALDRIDVIAGAAGDVFGSDALGGVIRMQSPVVSQPRGAFTLEAGTSDTYATDVSGGRAHGRLTWFVAASGVDSDGDIPLEAASAGPVDRPADVQWGNGFSRVEFTRGTGRWSVFAFGGRDDRGNGTVLQRNRMAGGTVAASFTTTSNTSTLAARLSVSPNAFDQTFSAVATGRVSETLTSTQHIESTTTRAAVEVGRTWSRGYGLVRGTVSRAGAAFSETRFGTTTDADLRDDSESLSAHVAWTGRQALTVSAGARQEWRAAPDDAASRDEALVGRAAVDWRARSGLLVRASAATSHRWPTLNELARGFRVGNAVTLPNPNLAPERAVALEAGVVADGARGRLGATVFHAVVNDAIANVTLPSLTGIVRERRNAGDAVSSGIEVDAEFRIGRIGSVTSSFSFVDATFERSQEPAIDGKRLPQVPRVSGTLAAILTTGPVTASLLVRSTGHQFDDDRNTFRLAEATQMDATVIVRRGRYRVFLKGENVLDARVETGRTPLVTLAPGRAARAGVSVSFGDFRR